MLPKYVRSKKSSIRKIKKTDAKIVDKVKEYFIFQEKAGTNQGVKLAPDAVSYVTSGLLDPQRKQLCLTYIRHSNQSTS